MELLLAVFYISWANSRSTIKNELQKIGTKQIRSTNDHDNLSFDSDTALIISTFHCNYTTSFRFSYRPDSAYVPMERTDEPFNPATVNSSYCSSYVAKEQGANIARHKLHKIVNQRANYQM